ncbi:hypothetical protein [Candidatus Clostridium radicumherbarum]|uniref:Uncharacterized protein n=1 Tax=Candidatus Clostridium radicumherbarum TaxID=3381662 RepID=A0ABW8TY08_9CLOT
MFFLIIFIGFKAYSNIKSNSLHKHISFNDVQSIKINASRISDHEEIQNIVNWFNSIQDINENPDFAGTTSNYNIEILLKSNEKIGIFYPGKANQDFEIQRNNIKGRWFSYWGNQPNIRKILEENTPK